MGEKSGDQEHVTSISMTDAEIVDFLQNQGHGTLALANQNDSYAVPVSFGYTDEHGGAIYLYLHQFGERSKKIEFAENADQVCLVTYDVESRERWRSAIVTGSLREMEPSVASVTSLSDQEYIDKVMGDNAWFPVFRSLEESITASYRYLLSIDEITGYQGGAYQ